MQMRLCHRAFLIQVAFALFSYKSNGERNPINFDYLTKRSNREPANHGRVIYHNSLHMQYYLIIIANLRRLTSCGLMPEIKTTEIGMFDPDRVRSPAGRR